jgi:hypothetical protein
MKRLCYQIIGCLALAALTVACEPPAVQVRFAQPFPVGTDPAGTFARADQGQYPAVGNPGTTLLVSPRWVLERRISTDTLLAGQLDSLGLPRQPGPGLGHDGQPYQLRRLGANTFQRRQERYDTLASLLGHARKQVRRYKGWYYLSTPADGQWRVERLGVLDGHFCWQYFDADSLRIRALQPQMVHLVRDGRQLQFTLSPQPGRQSRQVNRYNGLWLTLAEYEARPGVGAGG